MTTKLTEVDKAKKRSDSSKKSAATRKKNLADRVVTFGDPDSFQLICKAQSKSWMKSTKAMDIGGGCLVQVSTQTRNKDGGFAIAEALTYVPSVSIVEQTDAKGKVIGRKLIGN